MLRRPPSKPSNDATPKPKCNTLTNDEELFPMSQQVLIDLYKGRDLSTIPLPLQAFLTGAPSTDLTDEVIRSYMVERQIIRFRPQRIS